MGWEPCPDHSGPSVSLFASLTQGPRHRGSIPLGFWLLEQKGLHRILELFLVLHQTPSSWKIHCDQGGSNTNQVFKTLIWGNGLRRVQEQLIKPHCLCLRSRALEPRQPQLNLDPTFVSSVTLDRYLAPVSLRVLVCKREPTGLSSSESRVRKL